MFASILVVIETCLALSLLGWVHRQALP
jgi:hypothetical protein